jgi:flagellar biosynthesis protein FliR
VTPLDAPLASAWACGLVFLRAAGLCITMPVLSARVVPARVRIALAAMIAFAAWTGAGAPTAPPPESLAALAGGAAAETAFGLLAGLGARFVLQAALAAGHAASLGMGLGYGAVLDPTSGAESNVVGELVHTTAQAGAVALGIHREAVAWLARSARLFPPGAPLGLREAAMKVVWDGAGATALAVRLAFPMLAAVLLGHVVMGVLGRTAPQLSLGTIGFSIAVIAGGGAFYLVAPAAAELAARAAIAAIAK